MLITLEFKTLQRIGEEILSQKFSIEEIQWEHPAYHLLILNVLCDIFILSQFTGQFNLFSHRPP